MAWFWGTDNNSNAGHHIPETGYKGYIDCPKCKNGALVVLDKEHMQCHECNTIFTKSYLENIGILHKSNNRWK